MLTAFFTRQFQLSAYWAHSAGALLVVAIMVLTPNASLLPQAWIENPYNEKRLLQVLLTCVYGLMLILSRTGRDSWCKTLTALPLSARFCLTGVLGLGLLSAAFSPRPDAALLEVANLGLLFVLALGLATWAREAGQDATRLFCWGLTVMALAYEMRFLTGVLVILLEVAALPIPDLFMGFDNIRFFNQVQTWTLPLLALPSLWLAGRSPALRSIGFSVLTLWWLLLFMSEGRGVLIAVCGGGLLTLAVFRKTSLPWLRIQIAAAMTALAAYFAFNLITRSPTPSPTSLSDVPVLPQRLARAFEDPARLSIWRDAWDLFLQNPLLGGGPMHYAYYFPDTFLHPHNSVLQLLSEWGLVATLLLLLVSLWAVFAWIRQARGVAQENAQTLVRVALLASISGAPLHSLVSGLIVMPLSQLLAACVIGLILGDHLALRAKSTFASSQKQHDIGFVAILAVAVLALGCLAAISLFEPKGSLSAVGQVPNSPRFWVPGQLMPIEESLFSRTFQFY